MVFDTKPKRQAVNGLEGEGGGMSGAGLLLQRDTLW